MFFVLFVKRTMGEDFVTYNIHSLLHLVDQYIRLGPLPALSAMAFEAANHHLLKLHTGTVSHLTLTAKRYVQRQKRTKQYAGSSDRLLDPCVFSHPALPAAYSTASFFSRCVFRRRMYHSAQYSRVRKSCSSLVSFDENGHTSFGQVLVFGERSNGDHIAVLERLKIADRPFGSVFPEVGVLQQHFCGNFSGRIAIITLKMLRNLCFGKFGFPKTFSKGASMQNFAPVS